MAYTFKDDGASLTYYREYNKEVGTGDKTLVGNWVEERALRDAIDTGRYKLWVNTTSDPKEKQKTFTKFTTRPDVSATYQRTVVHSDHTPAAEFMTSNQVPDPGYSVYVNPEKGAREALLEKRALELSVVRDPARAMTHDCRGVHRAALTACSVSALSTHSHVATVRVLQVAPSKPELPPQYQSTYKNDYVSKDLPEAATLGRRVMMTQNMQDIKGAGDGLWRKECDIVSRHLVVEGTDAAPGQILTATGMKPARAFGKDTSFSTPISIYQKGEEKD